ncbi:uncharacterized protein FTOL_05651 [Fusarium torulosum]|uniref:Uncharacterized protein n=1 Tax=Fusarium torulosum TaxID=33205 RepID=A0AAE8M848_9HYPO|nr:uncharacterized protein FTOL_05651 [Fusarium torulosum]
MSTEPFSTTFSTILTKPATLIVANGVVNTTTIIDDLAISLALEQKVTVYNVISVVTADATTTTTTAESKSGETGAASTSTTSSTLAKETESGTGDTSNGITSTASTSKTGSAVASPASSDGSSGGLSGGAVAGAAIGCLIAGLALGLTAAFILFRRRRRSSSASPGFVQATRPDPEPKGGPQVTVASSGHDAELFQFLLEATPEKEIQAELRSLSELIYNHVENYYHGAQVQANSVEVAQSLVNIGYSPELSGLPAETVAAVCLAPKTCHVGLRHVISHIVFRSLDFGSASGLSMLPLPIAAMAQANPSAGSANSPAIFLARSRWRSLSALLLHPSPGERTPLPVSEVEAYANAHALANELNVFLQLFVVQDSVSQRNQTKHLQDVIVECTKLGYVVLSQPSDWRFVFSNNNLMDKSRRIVVCPGLEKLSHTDGTRYRSPKEVAAPETMPL